MHFILHMSDCELSRTHFFNFIVSSVIEITVLSAYFAVLEACNRQNAVVFHDSVCSCKLIINIYILLSTKEAVDEDCYDYDC